MPGLDLESSIRGYDDNCGDDERYRYLRIRTE